MKQHKLVFGLVLAAVLSGSLCTRADEVVVRNSLEFQQAARKLKPGTTVLLAQGSYRGGIYLHNVAGTDKAPVVIRGKDPNNPPVFTGGHQAIHLSDCSYITLSTIKVRGFPVNGINVDDGGSFETPAHHIILENLTILETGPEGNHDALKMSGVDHFVVRRCYIEGWGGSGIDMVGCHHGVVENCTFVGRKDFSQSNAVQLKGGTTNVLVHKSLFRNVGRRSINLGGSTGLQFFRPKAGNYEAKDITIAGNRFIGSIAPLAWATAYGGHVHHNTIVFPEKWVLRILQETKEPAFMPCHDGIFENNLIVYDSRVRVFVNVGAGTAPGTFIFRRNAWHQTDGFNKPVLPTPEKDGLYQVDLLPDKAALAEGKVSLKDKRLTDIGANGYRPKK